MKFQDDMIKHIETLCNKELLICDVHENWANTGIIYIRKGFITHATITYDFQMKTMNMKFESNLADLMASKNFYIEYTKTDEMQEFLNYLVQFIKRCA